jgi:murein hydrolase activator
MDSRFRDFLRGCTSKTPVHPPDGYNRRRCVAFGPKVGLFLILFSMTCIMSLSINETSLGQKTTPSKKNSIQKSTPGRKAGSASSRQSEKQKKGSLPKNRKGTKSQPAPVKQKKKSKEQKSKNEPRGASREVRMKQDELDRLKQEIKDYESKITESRKKEKNALNRIGDYEKQIVLLKKLVAQLSSGIERNEHEIDAAKGILVKTETELQKLRNAYARYVVSLYKKGRTHDSELLLSSASLNQMFIRAKYLKAFSLKHRSRTEAIREKKIQIEQDKNRLEVKLNMQKKAVSEKQTEETHLQKKTVEHKDLLDKVRQDKAEYEKQLRRKQIAAQKLERMIGDIIEKDRQKRLAELKKRNAATRSGKGAPRKSTEEKITSLPSVPISKTAFGKLRGRLPWPVSQGSVIGTFGEQTNPRIGTITINNGIDIKVPVGTAVHAVADGEVTMVSFIPGFGNLAIINHKDGFFTVYASLTTLSVRESQKVKAGQTIAKSGEGVSGPAVHFELYRERQKQNPLTWLSKR